MPLAVTPLPGPHGFGATVTGLQGASLAALDDATRDALLAGLDAHGVLVLKTGVVEPAALAAFADALFGAPTSRVTAHRPAI